MSDNRVAHRHRTYKGGTISFDRAAGIECIVRNLSSTGACLEMDSSFGIPDQFTLVIKPEALVRSCHVAWRTERKLGVQFG